MVRLSCADCQLWLSCFGWLSCSESPIMAALSRLSCLAILSWPAQSWCPHPICPVRHGCSVLIVLFCLFCLASPVLVRMSCLGQPFLAVLFWHSCSVTLCLHVLFYFVLFYLSSSGCLVVAAWFWLIVLGVVIWQCWTTDIGKSLFRHYVGICPIQDDIENICVPHHVANLLILSIALTMLELVSAPSLLPVQVRDHRVPHLQARKLCPDMDLPRPGPCNCVATSCSPCEPAKTAPALGLLVHTAQLPLS
jgi:hypothetical protein